MPSGSKPDEILRPGNVIRETWKVVRKLGEGGFGAVYEVLDKRTREHAAMKVESAVEKNQVLKMEVAVLKRLQGRKNFCKYLGCGRNDKFNYVVMSIVGKNLSDLRKATTSGRFSYSTGLRISKQCIEALSDMHDIGFLHRDIKPSNYSMGLKEMSRTVIMLDFGLARQYLNKGEVRPERSTVGFRGTVRYASLTTHNGQDMGRGDDLWSVIYMMVEFLSGALPWRKLTNRNDVAKMKQDTAYEDLFKGISCKEDLLVIAYHLSDLGYADAPDYDLIRRCMEKAMKKMKVKEDSPFDWEEGNEADSNSSVKDQNDSFDDQSFHENRLTRSSENSVLISQELLIGQ